MAIYNHYLLSENNENVSIANGDINKAILITASILSAIGCVITILTYICNKDIRTMSRHIIVCISVADLITCLSNLAGMSMPFQKNTTNGCTLQSFVSSTAVLCSFLWTVMLILYLFLVIVKEKLRSAKRMIFPWGHLLCWLLPLLINVIALVTKNLGNDTDSTSAGWCWIKTVTDDGKPRKDIDKTKILMWMLIDGKGIEIATYLIILVTCIIIKLHLKYKIRSFSRSESPYGTFLTRKTMVAAKQADRKLVFIPIILIILRIWGTIRFFFYAFDIQTAASEALVYLQAIGDNLQGAMNCLLFCFFTPKVFNHIMEGCFKCFHRVAGCCCCFSQNACSYERIGSGRGKTTDGSEEDGMTPPS